MPTACRFSELADSSSAAFPLQHLHLHFRDSASDPALCFNSHFKEIVRVMIQTFLLHLFLLESIHNVKYYDIIVLIAFLWL